MSDLENQAVKFIDKEWPENRLALGVKDQWAEIMAAFAKSKLEKAAKIAKEESGKIWILEPGGPEALAEKIKNLK